ncbi:basic proline-rich protein-like [Acinonyx jubatus]|uniref:Basic proline-rich protein-like n=1 Tax=Acinonyx jubatus TaxID=32536 RepID=A0ABM3NLW4_ACIJB|nr:basic proline-rich protein-like [Acinonyx jubatus]
MNGRRGAAPQTASRRRGFTSAALEATVSDRQANTHEHTRSEAPQSREFQRTRRECRRVPCAHGLPPFILRPTPRPPPPRKAPAPAALPHRPCPSGRGSLPCPPHPAGACHPAERGAGEGARLTPALGTAPRGYSRPLGRRGGARCWSGPPLLPRDSRQLCGAPPETARNQREGTALRTPLPGLPSPASEPPAPAPRAPPPTGVVVPGVPREAPVERRGATPPYSPTVSSPSAVYLTVPPAYRAPPSWTYSTSPVVKCPRPLQPPPRKRVPSWVSPPPRPQRQMTAAGSPVGRKRPSCSLLVNIRKTPPLGL